MDALCWLLEKQNVLLTHLVRYDRDNVCHLPIEAHPTLLPEIVLQCRVIRNRF